MISYSGLSLGLGLAFMSLDELQTLEKNEKVRFTPRKITYTAEERKRIAKRRNRNKAARKARKKQMQYVK